MDVERDLLCVGAPMLVVEAVCVFAVFGGSEGVVARGDATFVNLHVVVGRLDLDRQLLEGELYTRASKLSLTHPEVNLQVAAAAKLAVADLEGDGHLVVLVQGFVEAFALVSLHLDVVGRGIRQQAARRSEHGEGRKQHGGNCRRLLFGRVRGMNFRARQAIHGDASLPAIQGFRIILGSQRDFI